MTELQQLLFGKPHPLPIQRYIDPEVGNYGRRSKNYGRAIPTTEEATKSFKKFTVSDIAASTGMDRGTVNRALLKLEARGVVCKLESQTAGHSRGSAVWSRVITSPS